MTQPCTLKPPHMATIASIKGKGWIRDLPDFRDNTPGTVELSQKQQDRGVREPVRAVLQRINDKSKLSAKAKTAAAKSSKEDLRAWCSPIEDQGQLGSCTANAGIGLYEYF